MSLATLENCLSYHARFEIISWAQSLPHGNMIQAAHDNEALSVRRFRC